jgi:hypothetical protein
MLPISTVTKPMFIEIQVSKSVSGDQDSLVNAHIFRLRRRVRSDSAQDDKGIDKLAGIKQTRRD